MNYLQLCQRLRRECSIPGSGPDAVTGQSGLLQDLVNWVADAWREIQTKHPHWRWLRSRFTVNTVASDDTYAGTDCTDSRLSTPVTRFARWWPFDDEGHHNVRIYLQSDGVAGERYLIYMPWSQFRHVYKMGPQSNSFPVHFTIDPQNNLVLGPVPDAVYVIAGEYQMSAQEFAANDDDPEVHDDFHLLIVYEGMKKYGLFKSKRETLLRGEAEAIPLWRRLELNQLPAPSIAEPLA